MTHLPTLLDSRTEIRCDVVIRDDDDCEIKEYHYYEEYDVERVNPVLERFNKNFCLKFPEPIKSKSKKRNKSDISRYEIIKSATPKWVDKKQIKQIYEEAKKLSIETGIVHHVDHIVPIKHPLVCGLHIPENLQIITKKENLRKSNKFIID